MADVNEIVDRIIRMGAPGTYALGRLAADTNIAHSHWKEMNNTNSKLIKKYGRGAANGTDDYYHPLLQCHLAQMSDDDRVNGILLGLAKEYIWDYPAKRWQGQTHRNIINDSIKDLNNNDFGSTMGYNNRKRSCVDLLDGLRTENMRRANIR